MQETFDFIEVGDGYGSFNNTFLTRKWNYEGQKQRVNTITTHSKLEYFSSRGEMIKKFSSSVDFSYEGIGLKSKLESIKSNNQFEIFLAFTLVELIYEEALPHNYNIQNDLANIATNGVPPNFYLEYGDSYISSVKYGRVFVLLYHINTKNRKRKIEVEINIEKIPYFNGGGLFALDKLLEECTYQVHVFSKGYKTIPLTLDDKGLDIQKFLFDLNANKDEPVKIGFTYFFYFRLVVGTPLYNYLISIYNDFSKVNDSHDQVLEIKEKLQCNKISRIALDYSLSHGNGTTPPQTTEPANGTTPPQIAGPTNGTKDELTKLNDLLKKIDSIEKDYQSFKNDIALIHDNLLNYTNQCLSLVLDFKSNYIGQKKFIPIQIVDSSDVDRSIEFDLKVPKNSISLRFCVQSNVPDLTLRFYHISEPKKTRAFHKEHFHLYHIEDLDFGKSKISVDYPFFSTRYWSNETQFSEENDVGGFSRYYLEHKHKPDPTTSFKIVIEAQIPI